MATVPVTILEFTVEVTLFEANLDGDEIVEFQEAMRTAIADIGENVSKVRLILDDIADDEMDEGE